MNPHLSVRNLSFAYFNQDVISNITFDIDQGEFVGILGPNGSGKSTLLHLLSGLLIPHTGSIIISGTDTRRLSRRKWSQEVAIVFQDFNQNLDLECFDVVMMGRFSHWHRWQKENDRDYAAVQKAMQVTNTHSFANRSFRELSGGEKQRVMIARALAQEPNLLLLDEPTSHLDIVHQLDIMNILLELQKNSITIIGVFHDINLVAQFCNLVLFMKKGHITHQGMVETSLHTHLVEELFDVEFLEETHPYTFRPFFMPLSKKKTPEVSTATIHLICGGGSGCVFMKDFLEAGFSLSVGIVNQFDSDQEMAAKLGLPTIVEKPFSPFTDDTLKQALLRANQSDYIFISPGFWGYGNLKNLDLALNLLYKGKKVLFLRESLSPTWDYTGGEAINKLQQLLHDGAQTFNTISEVIAFIRIDPHATS